jgi:hypothetical protein
MFWLIVLVHRISCCTQTMGSKWRWNQIQYHLTIGPHSRQHLQLPQLLCRISLSSNRLNIPGGRAIGATLKQVFSHLLCVVSDCDTTDTSSGFDNPSIGFERFCAPNRLFTYIFNCGALWCCFGQRYLGRSLTVPRNLLADRDLFMIS